MQGQAAATADSIRGDRAAAEGEQRYAAAEGDLGQLSPDGRGAGGGGRELA